MRTAIILAGDVKQIVFTPENDSEKAALAMITPSDDIELLLKNGAFGNRGEQPYAASVEMCKGDFLRLFEDRDSRILVLRPKQKGEGS